MPEKWDRELEMATDEDAVAIVNILGTTGGQTPIIAAMLQLLRVR